MIYEDLRNLQKASYYYELAIECQLREVVPQEYEDLCFLYLYAGQLYDRLGNTDKAIDYLNETLTLQIEHLEGNNKLRVDTYKAMIKVEEKLGNQVLADDYRNKAQEFEARARSQSAVDNSSSSPR
jgi:tetratricopeptide (TPR) repeat protein